MVKFGGITSGITNGIPVVNLMVLPMVTYQWNFSGITSGISVILPVEYQ